MSDLIPAAGAEGEYFRPPPPEISSVSREVEGGGGRWVDRWMDLSRLVSMYKVPCTRRQA